MLETPSELTTFKERYHSRAPLFASQALEDLPLDHRTGLRILGYAPERNVEYGYPPKSRTGGGQHPYIWVLLDEGIRFIREVPIDSLNSDLPKHTNLTGGGPAYVGGQLWFETDETLFVSGGSGRYTPIDSGQLEAAVDVFRGYGYSVTSLGWDTLRNEPRRSLWVV